MRVVVFILSCLLLSGCFSMPVNRGAIGMGTHRRLVILGERIPKEHAMYYRRKYQAIVWFTPQRLKAADAIEKARQSLFGPTPARRKLINELLSTNYSLGEWEIMIPKSAERYFLVTLRHMKEGSWAKAKGKVVLLESKINRAIKRELERVTDGVLNVEGFDVE